jgi:hypothetical protein
MLMRSKLFVRGSRPERFAKAARSIALAEKAVGTVRRIQIASNIETPKGLRCREWTVD